MKVNQIRAGAALSYVSMALSTIISLVYTPIMLDRLGDSEFGVYQAVLPIISYLNLLSFGLGSAYVRYYSRFRAAGDKKGCAKLNGMFLITYLVLGAAVLAALLADRRLLRRVDYSLLLTFLFFFVFVGNMINESCHLSSKVEIMVSICLIAPYKYGNISTQIL